MHRPLLKRKGRRRIYLAPRRESVSLLRLKTYIGTVHVTLSFDKQKWLCPCLIKTW